MLYPNNIEDKLHFRFVRDEISHRCKSSLGREEVDAISFSSDYDSIMHQLREVDDMVRLIQSEDNDKLPHDQFSDPREMLSRIRIVGLFLEEEQLSSLRTILVMIRHTMLFFLSSIKNETAREVSILNAPYSTYPDLCLCAEDIQSFPLLIETIDRVVDKHGHIRDNASPELAQARREILSKKSTITKRLNQILRQAQADGIVESDAEISIRDGRAVIPVAAANKRRLQGIVMDESATGRTSYIEPTEIVMLNNDLRELQYAERREIIRILTSMSDNIRPYINDILDGVMMLAHIDFIRAKALYAIDTDAIMPEVVNKPESLICAGRHPLLLAQLKEQGKSIVPLDIELKKPSSRIAIISGPNAGGKSVCLQTVGILHYMTQCGLLIPVNEGSRMGIYNDIFIDMGDEQSIENDLSTYSSHLTNMKFFLRQSNEATLLLIDEFGTGTEPAIGGAIAESVLDQLNRRGAWGVITTHYTNLKHFAAQTDGIINSAMLFDTHNIEPLFKLRMGQPGSSFAFEIANKIGLPSEVLQAAKEKIGQEHLDFDKHLREIIRDKHYYEQRREQIHIREKHVENLENQYDTGLKHIRQERKEILEKARAEAKQLIEEANRIIENTIRGIRESQAEKEKTRLLREQMKSFRDQNLESPIDESQKENEELINRKIDKIRRRQEQREKRRNEQQPTTLPSPKEEPIVVGAYVMIDNNPERCGEVLRLNRNEAIVAMGNLQTNIKLNRLRTISRSAARKATKQSDASLQRVYSNVMEAVREKKLNFKAEIDIRGMRTDEAIEQVASFIDEAIICEQSQVRILHGKGNGILRQQIRLYLREINGVTAIRDEDVRMGGAGITVVDLNG
ncbi:MAG: Smr/MutS family protein [Marinilabiliaceae bacterium]|nr:Smr/MutS family protein [Marinilabiliaceae bacterium]